MKLFAKYNRILLLLLLAGLLAIGTSFYYTLSYFLNAKIDEGLREELMEVNDYMHVKNITPAPSDDDNLVVEYKPALRASGKRFYKDTTFYNPRKKITENARYLKTSIVINNKPVQVLILNSKSAQSREVQWIFAAIIIPVIIIFGLLALINRYLLLKLWSPFDQILKHIRALDLNHGSYKDTVTDVEEFRQLNESVKQMTRRIEGDFREVKLFTENASHEMMTPLAIINSKLDTLLQSDTLAEKDSRALRDLYKATTRLNKINQSLLLLVKIDHDLLGEQEWLDLSKLIGQKIENFQELILQRNLSLSFDTDHCRIMGNKYLIDILLNNLFSNAIRHNVEGGQISIKVSHGLLSFENTGLPTPLAEAHIFERFYKDPSSEGIGLGLAIMKQICNKQDCTLRYYFKSPMHGFDIGFKTVEAKQYEYQTDSLSAPL